MTMLASQQQFTRLDRENADRENTFLGTSKIRQCVLEARYSSLTCNFF
jgi:hypothetical protein